MSSWYSAYTVKHRNNFTLHYHIHIAHPRMPPSYVSIDVSYLYAVHTNLHVCFDIDCVGLIVQCPICMKPVCEFILHHKIFYLFIGVLHAGITF
jgi:hypothetical protein